LKVNKLTSDIVVGALKKAPTTFLSGRMASCRFPFNPITVNKFRRKDRYYRWVSTQRGSGK